MHKIWNLPRVDLLALRDHHEPRPVALVYSEEAWAVVEPQLRLDIASRLPVREATLASWERLAEEAEGSVVYAVGGGLAADAGKLVASRRGLSLWMIPTAISVDAPFTWASGYRKGGAVRYLETTMPERLLVDLDVIAGAPEPIRAAGITDVLSIATGSWDWRFAHERGRNPPDMTFQPWAGPSDRPRDSGAGPRGRRWCRPWGARRPAGAAGRSRARGAALQPARSLTPGGG